MLAALLALPRKEGQVGVIIQENPGQDQPVNVKAPSGGTWWFQDRFLISLSGG